MVSTHPPDDAYPPARDRLHRLLDAVLDTNDSGLADELLTRLPEAVPALQRTLPAVDSKTGTALRLLSGALGTARRLMDHDPALRPPEVVVVDAEVVSDPGFPPD